MSLATRTDHRPGTLASRGVSAHCLLSPSAQDPSKPLCWRRLGRGYGGRPAQPCHTLTSANPPLAPLTAGLPLCLALVSNCPLVWPARPRHCQGRLPRPRRSPSPHLRRCHLEPYFLVITGRWPGQIPGHPAVFEEDDRGQSCEAQDGTGCPASVQSTFC